jgi:putative aldouronate transport system substrate-binding protein
MEETMMNMKKTLVTAAGFLLAVALIGCTKSSNTAGAASGTTAGAAPAASAGAPADETGWFAGRNFANHMAIEIASVQIDDAKDYNNGDEFGQSWTKRFNINFDIISLTWNNWAESIRIWINSGDAPEVMVMDYNHSEAAGYAEQGMIYRFPDNWKTKYPNVAKAQANVPLAAIEENLMGGTYVLFRPLYSNNRPTKKLTDHQSLFLRKDWAAAVGVQLKEAMTLTEIFDYARKVKAANPGKVQNFYPINCQTGGISLFVMGNNTYNGYYTPYYKGSDGKHHWGPADPETLEALKLISAAYREGLIDPEFYSVTGTDDEARFYTAGTSAVMWRTAMATGMTSMDTYMKNDLGLNFNDVVQPVTLLGLDGHYHGYSLQNYWGAVAFSPDLDDAKFDRIMQMYDYSCTDDGQREIRLGVKGVDWDVNADGSVYSKLAPGEDLWEKRAMLPIYVNMLILSDDFQFSDPNYYDWARNYAKQMFIDRDNYSTDITVPPEPDQHVSLHSSRAMNQASMNYHDEYSSLITKAGNIETNWRTWVSEKMPIIQPVLNELDASL